MSLSVSTEATPRWRVERLVDDWIFIIFFVGNDFLPHLPSLKIWEGAVDRLVGIYKKLPTSSGDGFLHKDGILNMDRLEALMEELGKVRTS